MVISAKFGGDGLKNIPDVHIREFYPHLKGKSVPTIKMVDWVLNNLHREIGSIAHDEPPSWGSLVMLRWASENPNDFFSDFVAKLLPTKSQLEMGERQTDDGRFLSVLEALQEEVNAQSPQGPRGELGLPPEDLGTGEHERDGA